MKPQLMLDPPPDGDCLKTALCCLLNENGSNYPNFIKIDGESGPWPTWYLVMANWLAARGLSFLEMKLTDKTPFYGMPHETLCLLAGDNPAGHRHVVVGKITGIDFIEIFDPSPAKTGITNVDSVIFLVPLDPALIHDQPTLTLAEDMTLNVHKEVRWIVEAEITEGNWTEVSQHETEPDIETLKQSSWITRLKVIRTLTSIELLAIPHVAPET